MSMVVFIAGSIGSGKTTLAMGVAAQLHLRYYDADAVKRTALSGDPHHDAHLRGESVFCDAYRLRAYEAIAHDLAEIGAGTHVVMDEVLHKHALRMVLFDSARRYAGGYLLVALTTPEDVIFDRLRARPRAGHILPDPIPVYRAVQAVWEPFAHADITYPNTAPVEIAIRELATMVAERLGFRR